jgi:hypothetical protein
MMTLQTDERIFWSRMMSLNFSTVAYCLGKLWLIIPRFLRM